MHCSTQTADEPSHFLPNDRFGGTNFITMSVHLQECTAEMEFHLKWREEHSDKYPLKSLGSNHVLNNGPGSTDLWNMIQHSSHEPKMCSEYWEAVANTPIKLSDLPLPPLDELERK